MFRVIGLLLVLCIGFTNAYAETPVEKIGNLSVENANVVGGDGEPAQLRGMSFFWSKWKSQYYREDVVAWLAWDWKVNVLRAAMAVEDGGYLDDNDEKLAIEVVIKSAIKWGIYVIIDWHEENAYEHESEAIDFFEEMATKYGHYPNVIYEIYNEPVRVNWVTKVRPYAQNVANAIRAIDPDNVIIVGTPMWSQDVDVAAKNPVESNNIAYAFHFYASDYWHKQGLRDKGDEAITKGEAIFVSEWGVCESNGNGWFLQDSMNVWMDWMEKDKLSWTNWAISDKEETCSALMPGASNFGKWSLDDLTPSGKYLRSQIRELNAGLSETTIDTLVPDAPFEIETPPMQFDPTSIEINSIGKFQSMNWSIESNHLRIAWEGSMMNRSYKVMNTKGAVLLEGRPTQQSGESAFELNHSGALYLQWNEVQSITQRIQ